MALTSRTATETLVTDWMVEKVSLVEEKFLLWTLPSLPTARLSRIVDGKVEWHVLVKLDGVSLRTEFVTGFLIAQVTENMRAQFFDSFRCG